MLCGGFDASRPITCYIRANGWTSLNIDKCFDKRLPIGEKWEPSGTTNLFHFMNPSEVVENYYATYYRTDYSGTGRRYYITYGYWASFSALLDNTQDTRLVNSIFTRDKESLLRRVRALLRSSSDVKESDVLFIVESPGREQLPPPSKNDAI